MLNTATIFIKQAIKNLGPNVSENAISRISHSEAATKNIIDNVDDSILRVVRSGRHTHGFAEKDLQELLKRAQDTDIFTIHEGRCYKLYWLPKKQTCRLEYVRNF